MTETIAHAVYGVSKREAKEAGGRLELVSRTAGVTLQTAEQWRSTAPIEPRPASRNDDGSVLGIYTTPKRDFVVVKAFYNGADVTEPRYDYALVPRQVMRDLRGNITIFLDDADPARSQPWSIAHRTAALNNLLAAYSGDFTEVLSLLNAASSANGLLIVNHSGATAERLALVQGLMSLLPHVTRADLTFSTHVPRFTDPVTARVLFGEEQTTDRAMLNWADRLGALEDLPWNRYAELLAGFWPGDAAGLFKAMTRLDSLAERLPIEEDSVACLPIITRRYHFNARVTTQNTPIPADDLKEALQDADQVPTDWRRTYAELLLNHALEERDNEANNLVAAQMDADPTLDAELQQRLSNMLEDAPDLVYVFMRQRLADGVDERWLQRLHDAASQSLDVAFDSGETDLIVNWLRLIAREPERFRLQGLLYDGLRQAAPLALKSEKLALSLMVIAARFAPGVLVEYLDNDDVVAALPDPLPAAFTEFDPDALSDLQQHSVSLFLAGFMRAAQAQAGGAFTASVIERIWAINKEGKTFHPNAPYKPTDVLRVCAKTGGAWLSDTALETLLQLVISERDDVLFPALTANLAEQNLLGQHMTGALLRAGAPIDRSLDIMAMLLSSGKLAATEALEVYMDLLEAWDWDAEAHDIMEAAARLMMQNQTLTVGVDRLQRMLEVAAQNKDEAATRAAAIYLLNKHEHDDDDDDFIQATRYVFSYLAWSSTARNAVLTWWRAFAQQQPTPRLTRLARGLAGTRVTEDVVEILTSVIAMRRLMGKRDVAAFARDVNTTRDVLETLAEAFEPSEKGNGTGFDTETVREVLAKMTGELSPQKRQILSNSLKELANLIAAMGDSRSKAGLGRRPENLDRQFHIGEQTPHSAVDAMKWIAGYFSGAQQNGDEDH